MSVVELSGIERVVLLAASDLVEADESTDAVQLGHRTVERLHERDGKAFLAVQGRWGGLEPEISRLHDLGLIGIDRGMPTPRRVGSAGRAVDTEPVWIALTDAGRAAATELVE